MEFRSQKWRERANLHIVNRFYLLLFDNCVVVDCVVAERMLSFWHRHRQQEQSACPFSQRAVELMLMPPRIRFEQIMFQKSTFPQNPETIGTSFSRCFTLKGIAHAAFAAPFACFGACEWRFDNIRNRNGSSYGGSQSKTEQVRSELYRIEHFRRMQPSFDQK